MDYEPFISLFLNFQEVVVNILSSGKYSKDTHHIKQYCSDNDRPDEADKEDKCF